MVDGVGQKAVAQACSYLLDGEGDGCEGGRKDPRVSGRKWLPLMSEIQSNHLELLLHKLVPHGSDSLLGLVPPPLAPCPYLILR